MSTVLVDTNVLSYFFKGDSRRTLYSALLTGHRLAVSFSTIAELFEWAIIHRWGKARIERLEQALSAYLPIPVDIEVCRLWGTVRSQLRANGRPISSQDAWIAAAALRHQLPLITHNPSDFRSIVGLEVRSALPS